MDLKRLRQMSRDEIMYRFREKMRRETDRLRFHLGLGVEEDAEFAALLESQGSSLKTYLENTLAKRFYLGAQPASRDKVIGVLMRECPGCMQRAVEQGDRLLGHKIDFLGYSGVDLGAEINWHRDPISGHEWKQQYWADYDVVNGPSDPKVIHELNRHQHLPRLAKAFFITTDEKYAREAVDQIEWWIDQNRKWNGVNWQSSLEIAIRSISWMWALCLLLPSQALDERATRRILKSLFAQIDQIYRYPSIYSSPNTHLIGEAAAVFMAGLLFSELPRAGEWRRFGAATLVDEFERQVSSEGIYGEASTYYHCYATDFYLQAMVLARLNRFAFPQWMWNRLEKMLEYVAYLTRPDGSIPLVGDDDGGRVLALANEHYRTFQDGLSSGTVLFDRGDFKFQAGALAEESLWILGSDAHSIFETISAEPPKVTRRAYPKAGYFIQRSGWDANASHLTFDCGDLGMQSGGHGHADALALTLFSGGRDVLIDPGTSVYNRAPEWRRFFRSTRAHNTVVIDGKDQSEPGGTFKWQTKSATRVLGHIVRSGIEYIDAEHDGYSRLAQPIIHRRRLIHVESAYWIVLDEFQGTGHHKYELFYHFAPEAELFVFGDERLGEVDCRASLKEAGLHMFMYGSSAVQAEALCAQYKPIQGWSSTRYGERKPSPVLRATMHEQAPAAMMTFLMPGSEWKRSRQLYAKGGRSIAAVVRNGEYEDLVVQSLDGAALRLMDFSMRGEFFWIRTRNGAAVKVLAVNAQSFRVADEVLFDGPETIPYFIVHFWDNGMVMERGEHEGKVYVRDLRDRQFQRK